MGKYVRTVHIQTANSEPTEPIETASALRWDETENVDIPQKSRQDEDLRVAVRGQS